MLVYYNVDAACAAPPYVSRILTAPKHGRLEIRPTTIPNNAIRGWSPPDPRSNCKQAAFDGVEVIYTPQIDFVGEDRFVVELEEPDSAQVSEIIVRVAN